jgi:hypothetical protein
MNQTKLTSLICLIAVMLFAALCLCSCTLNPTIYTDNKGREIVTLGASVMTKAKEEYAAITRPDGTRIEHYRTGKDETAIPRYAIQAQAAAAIASVAGSVTKNAASNETARAVSSDAVKSTAITAPLEVEKARIAAEAATQ